MPRKIDRREFMIAAGAASAALATGALAMDQKPQLTKRAPKGAKSVAGLVTPKLDKVRVGFIGVGARGSGHVAQMMAIEGVEVKAICDNHVPSAERSAKRVVDKGLPAPTLYTKDEHDYKRMLERDDIDIVIIATPWEWHVPMAVDAMKAGKHAFVEVPASPTVEGCWELVDTSEVTQKHCMMMENVNYGREELMVLNMCRLGVFGELLHGEAAYIHDLRGQMFEIEHGTGSWRTYEYARRNGNLYPTHGLGPVAQYMNINRGDRLDYMSSVSSPSRVREIYAREHFPEGHERRNIKFVCGDINTSIVKSVKGKTIMVQWDEQLPRPYSRLNLIQGTKGVWGGFPDRVVSEGKTKGTEEWVEGDGLEAFYKEYDHPLWKRVGEEAKRMGGHGGMDFVMLWRIVYCLRNGLPLDQDVYDAATWSVIGPLSEWSVRNRSQSIDIPDFTRGKWEKMEPLGIVS
ncbi:MAG: alpha-N-acetylgalactosaminidase [Armatimonadetes bacterium 55-13]|nr:Gfo/Idh/MocA family oxidoreductase [Armatimonadota bacterium]OJU65643.1 MAG: alpha-N-acetylgalactosaminidase [Armatimonadetes bacterium 55-13]